MAAAGPEGLPPFHLSAWTAKKMNPYEQPSHTTISEKCLELWGTPDFIDAFLTEMQTNDSDLPLDDMCEGGSYPSIKDSAECTDLKIDDEEGEIVTGHFDVSFTRESPTGCRDMTWRDTVSGRIDFTLNLKDGTVTFEPPTPRKRQLDPRSAI